VGELTREALDVGCAKIIIGCDDSRTSDRGIGMLQALGVRFLDTDGEELPIAAECQSLSHLDKICSDELHPRLCEDADESELVRIRSKANDILVQRVQIEAVCNIKNVFCGSRGEARCMDLKRCHACASRPARYGIKSTRIGCRDYSNPGFVLCAR
jgi:glycerate kinase